MKRWRFLLVALVFTFQAEADFAWAAEAKGSVDVQFDEERGRCPAITVPAKVNDWDAKNRAWLERVVWEPFVKKTSAQPWGEAAAAFVRKSLAAWDPNQRRLTHPELLQEAKALGKDAAKDPLIGFFTAYWEWLNSKAFQDYTLRLHVMSNLTATDGARAIRAMRNDLQQLEKENFPRAVLRLFAGEIYMAHVNTGTRNEGRDLSRKIGEWTEPALKEGSYLDGELEIFAGHCFRWGGQPEQDALSFFPLLDRVDVPAWLREALKGNFAVYAAAEARGIGPGASDTQEGMKQFGNASAIAAEHLKASWQADPSHPEAAQRMMRLVLTGGVGEGEDAAVWFARAVSADANYRVTYASYLNRTRPSEGGSLAQMLAIGKACAETKRYDTEIPEFFATAVFDAVVEAEPGEWRRILREPWISRMLVEVTRGQKMTPARGDAKLWSELLMTRAWLAGDYDLARATLKELKGRDLNLVSVDELDRCGFYPDLMFAELEIHGTPAWASYAKATETLAAKAPDFAKARTQLAAALKALPEKSAAKEWLQSRLDAVDFQAQLPAGKWTTVPMNPALWHVRAGKARVEGGAAILESANDQRTAMLFDLPVGQDYEIRGKFAVADGSKGPAPIFGVAVRTFRGLKYHLDFLAEPEGGGTVFLTRLRSRFLNLRTVKNETPTDGKVPVQAENEFLLRVTSEALEFKVNGQVAVPEFRTPLFRVDNHEQFALVMPLHAPTQTKVTALEVRSLGNAEPAPPGPGESKSP